MKVKKEKSPYFPQLIEHIDSTWFRYKDFHYPFTGRDFSNLKNFCRSFQEWGIASLWDNFLKSDSDWVRKSGYSLDAFFKCLPWLVDTDWKIGAKVYEERWVPMKAVAVLELFGVASTLQANFKKATSEIRKENLNNEGLLA